MGPLVRAVGGIALLVIGVPAIVRRVLARVLGARVAASSPEEIVLADLHAVTLGQQSRGVLQGRGNGALVLTVNELWFTRAFPRSDVRIPLDAITDVTTVRSHLGKTYVRDLLRVSFRDGDTEDAIAWLVTDLAAWRAALARSGA